MPPSQKLVDNWQSYYRRLRWLSFFSSPPLLLTHNEKEFARSFPAFHHVLYESSDGGWLAISPPERTWPRRHFIAGLSWIGDNVGALFLFPQFNIILFVPGPLLRRQNVRTQCILLLYVLNHIHNSTAGAFVKFLIPPTPSEIHC